MKLDDLRQGVGTLWDSVVEGWGRLRQGAAGALTRYRPEEKSSLPAPDEVDDANYMPSASWAMLGGDVFEDDKRIVVRLEAPGMNLTFYRAGHAQLFATLAACISRSASSLTR